MESLLGGAAVNQEPVCWISIAEHRRELTKRVPAKARMRGVLTLDVLTFAAHRSDHRVPSVRRVGGFARCVVSVAAHLKVSGMEIIVMA